MAELPEHESLTRTVQDYVAGRLSDEDAAAFELRCLTDRELATELELALDIKAAAELAAARPTPVPTRASYWRTWAWLAAAALVVLAVGLSLVDFGGRPPEKLRGEETVLALTLAREARSIRLAWSPVEGAEGGYRAEIFGADGELVADTETTRTRVDLTVRGAAIGRALYARVQALGPLRQVIAESALEPVPADGGGSGS